MMDYLEILAVVLGIINVGLLIRRNIWNYPFGIVMVSVYGYIFFDAKLYSEAALQVFFLIIQFYGWARWREVKEQAGAINVSWSALAILLVSVVLTAALAIAVGTAMDRFTDAAAPYPDALIAMTSVTAQVLMVMRRTESWVYWIVVDCLAIWLFYTRDLTATSGLYAVFLLMAIIGLVQWMRTGKDGGA